MYYKWACSAVLRSFFASFCQVASVVLHDFYFFCGVPWECQLLPLLTIISVIVFLQIKHQTLEAILQAITCPISHPLTNTAWTNFSLPLNLREKKGEDKLALNLQRRICMQNNVDTPNQKQSKQRNTILHANCHGRAAILGNNAKCIPLHERMSLSRTCIHINADH